VTTVLTNMSLPFTNKISFFELLFADTTQINFGFFPAWRMFRNWVCHSDHKDYYVNKYIKIIMIDDF
jgi:hypothetical protein